MDKEKFIETYIRNESMTEIMKKNATDYLEAKALSYAYKTKIIDKVNKKITKAKRAYPAGESKKFMLVLGYNLFNLLIAFSEAKYSRLEKNRASSDGVTLWSMPILVSCNENVIDVVCTGEVLSWGFDPTPVRDGFLHNPLVDMDKLIEELPENGK